MLERRIKCVYRREGGGRGWRVITTTHGDGWKRGKEGEITCYEAVMSSLHLSLPVSWFAVARLLFYIYIRPIMTLTILSFKY